MTICHRLLAELLARWVGRGASSKKVPEVVFNSPSAVRRAFVEAWATAGGGTSVSAELLNGVMYLLLMEGCVATITPQKRKSTPRAGEREVKSRLPRFQLKFPRPQALKKGTWILKRKVGEPLYPVAQLPNPLKDLSTKTLKLGRSRVSERAFKVLEARVSRLPSYCNSSVKTRSKLGAAVSTAVSQAGEAVLGAVRGSQGLRRSLLR